VISGFRFNVYANTGHAFGIFIASVGALRSARLRRRLPWVLGFSMNRPIVGYHQDEEQHWVAELECGHNQHVRHDPPWINRPWVVTAEGRAQKLGALLACKKCDEGAPRDWAPVTDLPPTEDTPYLGDMVLLAANLDR
jgi:hypothetical protein